MASAVSSVASVIASPAPTLAAASAAASSKVTAACALGAGAPVALWVPLAAPAARRAGCIFAFEGAFGCRGWAAPVIVVVVVNAPDRTAAGRVRSSFRSAATCTSPDSRASAAAVSAACLAVSARSVWSFLDAWQCGAGGQMRLRNSN
jgi:hypothetical protein